jgi:hypothetical protein
LLKYLCFSLVMPITLLPDISTCMIMEWMRSLVRLGSYLGTHHLTPLTWVNIHRGIKDPLRVVHWRLCGSWGWAVWLRLIPQDFFEQKFYFQVSILP